MPEIPERVSNRWLAKLFTSEFLLSALIATFTAGVIWRNVEGSIAQAQTTADASAEKVERVETAVNSIKTDVEVIKANQANAASVDLEQTRQLAEQRRDIKTILRLVASRHEVDDAK